MRRAEARLPIGAFLRQVRPYRWHLSGLLLLSLLSPPLALLTPVPLKIVVDCVLGGRPLPGFLDVLLPAGLGRSGPVVLAFAVGLVLAVAFLSQLREFAGTVLSTYTSQGLLRDFRAALFQHVQRLSLSYHDTRGTADSTYRIQYDATAIPSIAVEGILPLLASTLTLVSMVWVVVQLNLRLAVVALAITPALFLVVRHYRTHLRRQAREVRRIENSTLGVVNEALSAARVVKAFRQEEREERRFVAQSREGMRAKIRMALSEGVFGLLVVVLTATGAAAALYIGTREVQNGALTLGELLLVMGYVTQLYGPLKTMGKKMGGLQSHLVGAERAFALLDEAPDVPERPQALPLSRARGDVEFRQVAFGYDAGRRVLHDLSFTVPAGTCVGIAGATGAGKTTLVNLLTRFYDPAQGAILLDGVDLRDYRLFDLRDQFGIVIQEPVLFSTSIAENIAYARPDASGEAIVAAARAANAHDFILRLPGGYETLVGERGMKLSGGERQRISLARAFLKDAPLLILDEPTSSVDAATEAAIVDAMERLMRGRTAFIITHRPSMLKHCRMVLRIDEGRLAEPVAGAAPLTALVLP
ncbi:MAG TPA: ABC transporter ATP-binding protein [Candidatus Cryosericum sp.]|nr:ABC transporter ATP-binding protein [Candidatus Cryosericum sp.]